MTYSNKKPQYRRESIFGASNTLIPMQIYTPEVSHPKSNQIKIESANLDTLAQLRNTSVTEAQRSYQNQAVKKFRTKNLVLSLVDIPSPLNKGYWNAYHCQNTILKRGTELQSKRCGNRWCFTCNGIKTADLVNGYSNAIQSMQNPYFITLTRKNVSGAELRGEIKAMIETFTRCKDSMRKDGVKLNGIRSIECTYNATKGTYHPHFHILLDGCREAFSLVRWWLLKNEGTANFKGQDFKVADKNSPLELFKYITKLVGTDDKVSPQSLDVIFQAFRRVRTVQSFGNIKKLERPLKESNGCDWREPDNDIFTHQYAKQFSDWYNAQGEALTDVIISSEELELADRLNRKSSPQISLDEIEKQSVKIKQPIGIESYWERHKSEWQ